MSKISIVNVLVNVSRGQVLIDVLLNEQKINRCSSRVSHPPLRIHLCLGMFDMQNPYFLTCKFLITSIGYFLINLISAINIFVYFLKAC